MERTRKKLRMPVGELASLYNEEMYSEPLGWERMDADERAAWMAAEPKYQVQELEEGDADFDKGRQFFRIIVLRLSDGRLFATVGGTDMNEEVWFGAYSPRDAADKQVTLEEVFEETVTKIVYV